MSAEEVKQNAAGEKSKGGFEFRKHPTFYETYSNYMNITWTLYDLRIRFAEIVPTLVKPGDDPRGFAAEEKAAITMSWHQAKALHLMLTDAIGRFEKTNGEIKTLELAE